MALTLKELQNKMVPASAKAGKDIDSQYLKPASYDKKARKAFIDDENPHVVSQQDMNDTSQNFKAQDTVKKHTGAPLREYGEESSVPSYGDIKVNIAYEDEALDLLEEISELVESLESDSGYFWQDVASHLKQARNCLLRHTIGEGALDESNHFLEEPFVQELDEEMLEEAFKHGNFKLRDGSKVKLTKEDAAALNAAIAGTKNASKLVNEITENEKEFLHFLSFAKSLDEDFETIIDNFLSESTYKELETLSESGDVDLHEVYTHARHGAVVAGEIGRRIGSFSGAVAGGAIGAGLGVAGGIARNARLIGDSAVSGAAAGRKIGAAAGAAGMGSFGAAAGASIGAAKKAAQLSDLIKKWNAKKEIREENNEKESVLGTSAPAMDSDKKKKEDLQEINSFNYKPARKGTVKWVRQQQAKSGEYEDGITKPLDDNFKKGKEPKEDLSNEAFKKDVESYKKADRATRLKLEKKWGARAAYFKEEAEDLQEISSKTLNSYIDGAMDDQKAAMLTRSSNQIKNNKKFGSTKEIRDFVNKRQKGIDKAEAALERKEAINKLYTKLGLTKLVKEDVDLQEDDHRGGHPANYRNPAENWKPKFNKVEPPVKQDTIAIITNDKKNIDGPLATKVGDIVNVKFSRVEFFRMKVIEMLPNNKIKVQAFRR